MNIVLFCIMLLIVFVVYKENYEHFEDNSQYYKQREKLLSCNKYRCLINNLTDGHKLCSKLNSDGCRLKLNDYADNKIQHLRYQRAIFGSAYDSFTPSN
jgi:hypothetical protein